MTINMVGKMYFGFQIDHDMEAFLEIYEEMMELISETGYEAVDVTSLETSIMGINTVNKILNKYHLKAGSYIYFEQFAAMDEEQFETRVEKAKQAVDDAILMGSKVLMLVPQAQENITECTPEQIHAQLIKHWIPVAAYAQSKGVHPVVEDTPDLRLHFCTTAEMKEVLDAVSGLEIVYDSGNMVLVGEDPVSYYDTFADRVGHIHLKDMRLADAGEMFADTAADGTKMTGAPTGTGIVDLKTVMEHVREHGYEGYLTVEFAVDADNDYRKSLIRSRKYLEALL
jgi:sugar phosphate isomerase/epimerase